MHRAWRRGHTARRSPIGWRKRGREAPLIRFVSRKSILLYSRLDAFGNNHRTGLGQHDVRCSQVVWLLVVEGERRRWWEVCCGGWAVVGRRLRMGVRRCLRGWVVEVKVVAVWCSCSGALLVVVIWLLGGDWSKIGPKQRVAARINHTYSL